MSKFTAPKPTVKPVAAAAAKATKPKTAPKAESVEVADEVVEPASAFERLHQKVHGAYTEFLRESGVVGPKQRIAAWVCGAIVAFGAGYLGGYISALLMATVVFATSSLFLGFLIYFLGVLLSIWIGASMGFAVQQFVLGVNQRAISNVKSRVSSFFNRNSVEAAHA